MELTKTNWTVIAGIGAVLLVFLAVWLSKNAQASNSVTTITGSGNSTNNITNQNTHKQNTTNVTFDNIANGIMGKS